jgi:hypothetical protein
MGDLGSGPVGLDARAAVGVRLASALRITVTEALALFG